LARIHPTAEVERGAVIGAGSVVWRHAHVMKGARIGRRCMLGQGCFVGAGARVGDGCRLQNHVSLYGGVELGDEVFVGPSAVFTNVKRPRAAYPKKPAYETTLVGRGATIGANATIVCGVTIGAHAFVGAGAVVTRDVPDHALVLGSPARVEGWICACGERVARSRARPRRAWCTACQIGPSRTKSRSSQPSDSA
jgi:UDP-2-acetamido-3-amino-2,3-dideoxy-glucuronate N-acetyltransferase